MQIKYYYIRDNKNRPIITICLIKDSESNISRGIAICSDKDQPCKKVGRNIARERAIYAITEKEKGCKIRGKEINPSLYNFVYKSMYNPVLTGFEKKLFLK